MKEPPDCEETEKIGAKWAKWHSRHSNCLTWVEFSRSASLQSRENRQLDTGRRGRTDWSNAPYQRVRVDNLTTYVDRFGLCAVDTRAARADRRIVRTRRPQGGNSQGLDCTQPAWLVVVAQIHLGTVGSAPRVKCRALKHGRVTVCGWNSRKENLQEDYARRRRVSTSGPQLGLVHSYLQNVQNARGVGAWPAGSTRVFA